MKQHIVWALLGLFLAAAAAQAPAPLEPRAGYLAADGAPSGGQSLFAPWRVWAAEEGNVLRNTTAESQEECAALCWQELNCTLFDFRSCAGQVGTVLAAREPGGRAACCPPCLTDGTAANTTALSPLHPHAQNTSASCAGVPPNTCRLLSMDCGDVAPLAERVEPSGGDVRWAAAGGAVLGSQGCGRRPGRQAGLRVAGHSSLSLSLWAPPSPQARASSPPSMPSPSSPPQASRCARSCRTASLLVWYRARASRAANLLATTR